MTATPPPDPPSPSPAQPGAGSPPGPRPPAPGHDAPLERIEAAVEQAVERVEQAVDSAIEVADRSLAARFGARTMRLLRGAGRALAIGLVALWFAFGIAVLATRYVLVPRIDEARGWIEREASLALGAQVSAARIEASWSGLNPTLRLADVQLRDARGGLALALPQLDATVSWLSAPLLSLRFTSLSIVAPELEVRRLADRRWSIGGIELRPDTRAGDGSRALDWLLAQNLIVVRDARLRYVDARGAEPRVTVFDDVHLALAAGFRSHVLSLQARPPAELAGAIDVRARIEHGLTERTGDLARWDGRLFAEVGFADFARLDELLETLPAGMHVERGQGALRLWLDFEDLAVRRVVADLAVSDVVAQLAADLEPLRVAHVRGRVAHRALDAPAPGHEVGLAGFALQQQERALLAPTDLTLRRFEAAGDRAARTELTVGRLDLDTLAALAQHVPLARDLRAALARLEPRGIVSDLVLAVDGALASPQRYSLRTRFEGLSIAAQPAAPATDAKGHARAGLPGASGLDGSLEATEAGGAATVRATRAVLDLPGVFDAPRIALDQLSAAVRWNAAPQWNVRIESLNAANADFEFNASGSWTAAADGPGTVDLSAKFPRLAVRAAPRYVPLAVGATTRAWLAGALRGGKGSEGTVRLRGDLRAFPFAQPGSGEFRASVRVRDGDLAIQPTPDGASRPPWPPIEDIDADVVFERHTMRIATRSARVYGARIAPSEVRIPDLLSDDGHLVVVGGASGPLADLLRFVADSPVSGWLGHALDEATGTGSARVELKFDMPLWHARDTLVEGRVVLANNDVTLWSDLPAFTRASGRVEFTASGFRIEPTSAGFLGGTVRLEGGTRPDGRIAFTATGTATPAGARRLSDIGPLNNVLDRAQGTTNYRAQVSLAPGSGRRPEIRVESDLVGWSVDATAPLRKTTSESMPLLVEIGLPGPDPRNPRRDEIRFALGNAAAGRFERAAEQDTRPGRGTLALGAPGTGALATAPGSPGAEGRSLALPASGFQVLIDLPRLDADRLLALVGSPIGGSATTGATPGTAAPTADPGTAPPFPLPDRIAAEVRELTFGGKAVSRLRLGALKGTDGAWRASVASEQVNGTVVWRPPSTGQSAGGVVARLKRLAIEPRETEVLDLLESSTTSVPALDIAADEFVLGKRTLGRLELAATNSGSGAGAVWNLSKLELAAPEARLHGSGQWRREAGQGARTMALDLTLDFTDAGALLARVGMPEAVRGGSGQLSGSLSWRGSPFAIDYPTLGGTLKLASAKGQFLKAEPGAARLLGVISLQSLPRRITLDFRDVFSEGFAFDAISATAEMKSGVMRTQDFRMSGPSATVLLEGSTDLRAETQALHVVVLPELNLMAGSIAYALLANPAIGIGTFVAQLLLKDPLSKALSYEFDVGGSWSEPAVTRRARTAATDATPPVR